MIKCPTCNKEGIKYMDYIAFNQAECKYCRYYNSKDLINEVNYPKEI